MDSKSRYAFHREQNIGPSSGGLNRTPTFGVSGLISNATDELFRKLETSSIGAFEAGFDSGLPNEFPRRVQLLGREHNIRLNLHLPFYFSWTDPRKIDISRTTLEKGARLASQVEGVAVFHLGQSGGLSFETLRPTIVACIHDTLEKVASTYSTSPFLLGIETSGRLSELGSIEQICQLVKELSSESVIPVIDWSHIYARSNGRLPRTVSDYSHLIAALEEVSPKCFYFHGSGIEFDNFQEKRHLSAKACTPPLPHLLKVLREGGYEYTLIVESPSAVEDALWLKEVNNDPSSWIKFAENKMVESGLQVTLD